MMLIDPIALTSVYAAILDAQMFKRQRERMLECQRERMLECQRVTGISEVTMGQSVIGQALRCAYCKSTVTSVRCPSCGATARE